MNKPVTTILYICNGKRCPSPKYCDPCFRTTDKDYAANPESIKLAQDFLDHFDIELETRATDLDGEIIVKYDFIFREKPSANLSRS